MSPRPWLAAGRRRQLARPGTGVSLYSVADELLATAIRSKPQTKNSKRKGSCSNWGRNILIGVKNLRFLYPSSPDYIFFTPFVCPQGSGYENLDEVDCSWAFEQMAAARSSSATEHNETPVPGCQLSPAAHNQPGSWRHDGILLLRGLSRQCWCGLPGWRGMGPGERARLIRPQSVCRHRNYHFILLRLSGGPANRESFQTRPHSAWCALP